MGSWFVNSFDFCSGVSGTGKRTIFTAIPTTKEIIRRGNSKSISLELKDDKLSQKDDFFSISECFSDDDITNK